MRGNRTSKISAENFNAFRSINYPALARAGVHIQYNASLICRPVLRKPLKAHYLMDTHVVILKLFPGITPQTVQCILNIPDLKGVVMETYGTGNASTVPWFLDMLRMR